MIYRSGKDIDYIRYGTMIVNTVYHGSVLIWQAIRSCFGAGCWINEKPWLDTEGWKD